MQEDKGQTPLGSVLDRLDAGGVVPGWDKAGAWEKLEHRLGRKERKKIPVRTFPALMAAAVVLYALLLRSPVAQDELPVTVRKPESSAVSAAIAANDAVPEVIATVSPTEIKEAVKAQRLSLPVQQATPGHSDTAVQIQNKLAVVPEPAPLPIAPVQPPAEVIYTLSEIVADVPEREDPLLVLPKPVRRRTATEARTVDRRRAIPPYEEPSTHLIIN